MAFSILQFSKTLCGSQEDIVGYLQGKNLLASQKTCTVCQTVMHLQKRSDISDGFRYYKIKIYK